MAVMAILSIGAAILAPAILRTMDRMAGEAEDKNLAILADGLRRHILLDRQIPGPATGEWDVSIAAEASLSRNQVRINSRGNQRRYLSNLSLPYLQDAGGISTQPENPRVILLSSMGKELDAISFNFEELWEGNPVSAGWTGKESDLKIHRIHLSSFFHRIALNSVHTESPSFTVDGVTGPSSFPEILTFLSGSELRLFDHDGILQLVHIVLRDEVFTYSGDEENGHWR